MFYNGIIGVRIEKLNLKRIIIQKGWIEKQTGEEDDNANKSVSYNPCSHLLPFEVEEDFLRQTLKMNSKYTSTKTHSGQYLEKVKKFTRIYLAKH